MTTTVLAIGLLAEPSRYRHRDIARLGHFGTRDATQPIASRLGTKANIDTMAYSGCHTSKKTTVNDTGSESAIDAETTAPQGYSAMGTGVNAQGEPAADTGISKS